MFRARKSQFSVHRQGVKTTENFLKVFQVSNSNLVFNFTCTFREDKNMKKKVNDKCYRTALLII